MNAIIDAALSHSRTVLASLVAILVTGLYTYITIPKESAPDIPIPVMYVSATLEGISPDDAERLLIRPLEEEMQSIEGVKEMRSTGYEGGAYVVLEFEAGFNADTALTDVREAVDDAKPDLPEDADEPTVHEINFSLFPVIVITLAGEVPERTLVRIARSLRDDLKALPPVLEAKIQGQREEQAEIIIDPLTVESYGLSADEVASSISRSNRLVAAGALDTGHGRFSIKVPGLFESVEDIVDLPVKVNDDTVITLEEIATGRRGYKDRISYARLNGEPAVALEVSKRAGENVIETIRQVRDVVDSRRQFWPEGLTVTFTQDRSEDIYQMLSDLQNNVIAAVVLVMIVVVAALGLRAGALVGVAIPGSFLTGLLVLSMLGLTLNMVVLFSLILAVGMLVDGAIIVTEFADRRMTEGVGRREAYREAAKRMAWPVLTSTATTLCAFLPLLFWPGVVGEFMKFLPITLVATLAASLLMALIFVPTLGAYIDRPSGTADPATVAVLEPGSTEKLYTLPGFTGRYIRLLRRALLHPGKVLAGTLALLFLVQAAYAVSGAGIEFVPDVEPERATVEIHARGNLSVAEKDALVRQVEARVLRLDARYGEMDSVYARSGEQQSVEDRAEDVIGSIQIEFGDWSDRRPARQIMDDIVASTADLAGIRVEVREEEQGPPVGKPVQIELSSIDPALLPDAVERVRSALLQLGGFRDIEDNRPIPGIEWKLEVDRPQAAKFGADVSAVGSAIKLVTKGLKVGEYRPDDTDDEIDIVVRYPEDYRNLDKIDDVRVQTDSGLIPISNFVQRVPDAKTGTIRRVDGDRVMTVKAELAEGVLADTKVRELQNWFSSADWDPRVKVAFKGEDEEQRAATEFLSRAFLVTLGLMAIILVTQFNSFYSVFLILSAIIMSTLGVMVGLLIIHQPFGIVMSGIGVIALAGIVVNNNIVLIDTYDRLVVEEKNPLDAIVRTGAQRLRPVLLTSVTTALGLLPMVLSTNINLITREIEVGGPSTQWWVQLSTAIVSGLLFATVLTLFVTPCALMVRHNFRNWLTRRRQRSEAARAAV